MKIFKVILFWIVSCTWGILMALFGVLVSLSLLLSGHKPKIFHYLVYFEVGENWGGFEAGPFFVVNKVAELTIKQHEAGHGLQNIMLGPFMPFFICIPSAIRYWYRKIIVKTGRKKASDLPPYDSIWFEGWATQLGKKHFG